MSLWKIAWRSIEQRGLASSLTAFSMALGVMLVVAVLSIHGVVQTSFRNNANLGYNLIVGAKGGKLQLTLNSVYYLSQPIENIPYELYLEFLPQAARQAELQLALRARGEGRDGEFAPYVDFAIPLCLGDYFGRFRVVGTTPDMFEQLKFGAEGERAYEFAQGRNFQRRSDEHGFFEAVVGATVAAEMGVQLGDLISTTHGDPEGMGHGRKFTVVGILAPTGTPNDRAAFVNMEGFYLMKGHAKPLQAPGADGAMPGLPRPDDVATRELVAGEVVIDDDHSASLPDQLAIPPLPIEQREVTAILVRTASNLVAPLLQNTINEGNQAQVVLPVLEIFTLFEVFVKPVQLILLVLTAMICIVSGVSILVSIYNSMAGRRHEIAVMRALGASRTAVLSIILIESIMLSVGGGGIGWVLGHALNWLAGPVIERRTGVSIGFFDFAPSVNVYELLGGRGDVHWLSISSEILLIPFLLLLAVIVGFLPALAAYRTDVAASLGK
ncbi:MAG: ABC transporter permease [Pirellulaceae bacterium]|nr:ABC transporter permease [Pirellulaceae bacterium]